MSDAGTPFDAQTPSPAEALSNTQYWLADSEGKYYLTVLSNGTLYLLENAKQKSVRTAIEAMQAGTPAVAALGDASVEIPVGTIAKLAIAEHDNCLKLWHGTTENAKKQTVLMASYPEQQQLLDALAELIPGANRAEQPLPIGRAILGPSLTILGILAGTIVCYLAAADIDPNKEFNPVGRRSGMKKLAHNLLSTIGPTGVAVIGGVAILGAGFWLYRRINNPPTEIIVERTSAAT